MIEFAPALPELPEARAQRFQAAVWADAPTTPRCSPTLRDDADTYEALVAAGVPAKLAANWQSGDVAALANEHRVPLRQSGLGIDGLASLLRLVEGGTINGPTAKELLAELYVSGGNPEALVRERGLAQVSDTAELARWWTPPSRRIPPLQPISARASNRHSDS